MIACSVLQWNAEGSSRFLRQFRPFTIETCESLSGTRSFATREPSSGLDWKVSAIT